MRRNGRHPASRGKQKKTPLQREDGRVIRALRAGEPLTHRACGGHPVTLEPITEKAVCEQCGAFAKIEDDQLVPLARRTNIGAPA